MLWTVLCPFRTRDENDRKAEHDACDKFLPDTEIYYWNKLKTKKTYKRGNLG